MKSLKKYSVKQFADLNGVSRQAILMQILRGTLKNARATKVGKAYVIETVN